MSRTWVDEEEYFGPNRREEGRMRWRERRRKDSAKAPPSLGSVMRRLRVQAANVTSDEQRLALIEHLQAAVQLAELLGMIHCSQQLTRLAAAAGETSGVELEETLEQGLADVQVLATNIEGGPGSFSR